MVFNGFKKTKSNCVATPKYFNLINGARDTLQLPLIGLASRFFICTILYIKVFYDLETLDYSPFFLGVAMMVRLFFCSDLTLYPDETSV